MTVVIFWPIALFRRLLRFTHPKSTSSYGLQQYLGREMTEINRSLRALSIVFNNARKYSRGEGTRRLRQSHDRSHCYKRGRATLAMTVFP